MPATVAGPVTPRVPTPPPPGDSTNALPTFKAAVIEVTDEIDPLVSSTVSVVMEPPVTVSEPPFTRTVP